MSEITIKNDVNYQNEEDSLTEGHVGKTSSCHVTVTYWDTTLVTDLEISEESSKTISTTNECTVTATLAAGTQKGATISFSSTSAQVVASVEGDDFVLTKQEETGAKAMTFINFCSSPVMFVFEPSGAPSQSYMVGPEQQLSVTTEKEWQVSATLKLTDSSLTIDTVTWDFTGFTNNPNAVFTIYDKGNGQYDMKVDD